MPYIDDNTQYQFVKFKDGKEVFAMVREVFTEDQLELHFPMNVQLAPAMTGGVLVHLGPYIPFTKEDSITVDTNSVLFRTSISPKFINFYDEACSAWLNIRDNDKIEIKSGKQVWEEQKQVMEGLVKKRFETEDIDFRDEIDYMLDEIEEEQEEHLLPNKSLPGKDDIIH
jgi:hypothetical protein